MKFKLKQIGDQLRGDPIPMDGLECLARNCRLAQGPIALIVIGP